MILMVIGGSSDMGMSLIRFLAPKYDTIVAHYRSGSPALDQLKQDLGEKLMLQQADLSVPQETSDMMDRISRAGMMPDHIVHFAAPVCNNKQFHKMAFSEFEQSMQIGFFSLVQILQKVIPFMAKKKKGKVVVMLSNVLKDMPPAYCSQYVTAKYAMLGLVRALASEYTGKNISINAVSPGWTQTKYIANQPDLLVEKYIQQSPRGKLLSPEEVASVVAMLLSDVADHIHGENINIS